MGQLVKGAIVILPFPFSDLSGFKRRPAFVVTDLSGDTIILCQIARKAKSDSVSVLIQNKDFSSNSLPINNFIRPNKMQTRPLSYPSPVN
jgi:mRNA interferase MazF